MGGVEIKLDSEEIRYIMFNDGVGLLDLRQHQICEWPAGIAAVRDTHSAPAILEPWTITECAFLNDLSLSAGFSCYSCHSPITGLLIPDRADCQGRVCGIRPNRVRSMFMGDFTVVDGWWSVD
ncbi:hypothetical protein Tco_1171792 [Tanacetum coccineum]